MKALRIYRARFDALSTRVAAELGSILGSEPETLALEAMRLMDEQTTPFSVACSAGCSHCCHVNVEATESEVVAVARHLERTLTPDALAAFRGALAEHVARVRTLSDEERWTARIPCALLGSDGRCSVYPVRPLRCRAFHSLSAAACRDAFDGTSTDVPDVDVTLTRTTDAVEAGYDAVRAQRTALLEASLSALLEAD